MDLLTALLVCPFAVLVVWRYLARRGLSSRHPSPPGPRGLPIIGNLLDIPSAPTWENYRKMSNEYGSPLLRLNVMGFNLIVVNTLKATLDLLDTRSAIYSDRPQLVMIPELCGFGWAFTSLPYGREWRNKRKAFHSQFHIQATTRFRPIEERATLQLLRKIFEKPADFREHVKHLVASEIMEIAYGIRIKEENDPFVQLAEEGVACTQVYGSFGAAFVDVFPILKHIPEWVPGAGFQRKAKEFKAAVLRMKNEPWDECIRRTERDGYATECVATSLLETIADRGAGEAPYTEEEIKAVAGTMYAAGADSSTSAILSLILAMVQFPEVQTKAQEELDRVCAGRLPTFDDVDALPYVEAIVREALRWNPVFPEAIPHSLVEDDVYEGYYLPKGSIIVPNNWAILHDETHYPDPFSFNPDRFMKDGALNPEVLDPSAAAFGYGRRICPGRHMAHDAVWIAVAYILSVFDIQPVRDSDGRAIIPAGEYDHVFLRSPKPFDCVIRPRSARHEALIAGSA